MENSEVLEAAIDAGRIILESGGETYRVEETILRVCRAFGVADADCFVTPTGIIVSVKDSAGRVVSQVKSIESRTVNLDKISRVNDLSRRLSTKAAELGQVREQLRAIDAAAGYSKYVILAASSVGAGVFTLLFGGDLRDAAVGCVIGFLIRLLIMLQKAAGVNDFFVNVTGGAVAALVALIAQRYGIAAHLNVIVIGSIMLLVPGMAIMNAIRDTIAGDLLSGVSRGVEALLIAAAIAVGTGIVMLLWVKMLGGF
ncbi:MAG: threonine/serine exporter family protein [Clostridia bacterium]|nr:threonine/serine exporter family protein [Clostridia bacterium]